MKVENFKKKIDQFKKGRKKRENESEKRKEE